MNINDTFEFGQYESLSLIDVYRGSQFIDREMLKGYLEFCFSDNTIPKSIEFDLCTLQIGINEMNIIPYIHNEDKTASLKNKIEMGDLSMLLNNYFNNYFSKKLLETIPSFQHFNRDNGPSIIGGNPEYIVWCINNIPGFNLNKETKNELEEKVVHRLIGISIEKVKGLKNQYIYKPVIKEEFFKF